MTAVYDARGNIYAVAAPRDLARAAVSIPANPTDAARTAPIWASQALDAVCGRSGTGEVGKEHSTDGLLVGPFGDSAPFDVLIVNTDGTLAEKSGNGLTIFARALADQGRVTTATPLVLRVHHDKADKSPTCTTVEMVDQGDGRFAFWVDLGQPQFGPEAVRAGKSHIQAAQESGSVRVTALAKLNPTWARSVFVRIGNPHCVTILSDPTVLPDMMTLRAQPLRAALARIAFAASAHGVGAGEPCAEGVNLQWAALASKDHIAARVFERGEGPTASSGTSAAAVASAAWHQGLIGAGRVVVEMPGGSAPLDLIEEDGRLRSVRLLGEALKHSWPEGGG